MSKKEKSEVINLRARVEILATGKCGQRKEGESFKCHPKLAEALVKKGFAIQE